MKLGSLFDGAGTCPLAGVLTGFIPVWASEIESFPISVTKKRFTNMKHLGDVTKINGADIEPVDLITFGSPCQDLSVAGKREGIKHKENGDGETTRSGLFMEAIRIIKEMRGATDGKYPRFAMWENVPGAFSSNDGEDFRIVLEELCRVKDSGANVPRPEAQGGRPSWRNAGAILGDGFSIAWRVLDAEYWGVPQRRRRIFLVADFGSECAEEILFKRDGLSRNFAEMRKSLERSPSDSSFSTAVSGKCYDGRGNGDEYLFEPCYWDGSQVAECLTASGADGSSRMPDKRKFTAVLENHSSKYLVRRLTPTECARLQGMPDWWCSDIPHKDAPEYKMWGNGMALPCIIYVFEGIKEKLKERKDV